MKASTREWIKRAESDWPVAVSLTERRKTKIVSRITPGNGAEGADDYCVTLTRPKRRGRAGTKI